AAASGSWYIEDREESYAACWAMYSAVLPCVLASVIPRKSRSSHGSVGSVSAQTRRSCPITRPRSLREEIISHHAKSHSCPRELRELSSTSRYQVSSAPYFMGSGRNWLSDCERGGFLREWVQARARPGRTSA